MKTTKVGLIHPGSYVKKRVIPKGMTITKAASLLGIGRPALSNFLNGKSSLSPKMALRLETTFGTDRHKLLEMQATYTRTQDVKRSPIVASPYAPVIVQIKSSEIVNWADKIHSRSEFPALIRRLVYSTGIDLTMVDFPAYDEIERQGWDGTVETLTPTPWIPSGNSLWELSCSRRVRDKAEKDYRKRSKSVSPKLKNDSCFIFVTPRKWNSKKKWVEEKLQLGDWKEVRVYDASDLEQWLEQSTSTQIWFAERLSKPIIGFRTLERCWSEWAKTCEPALSPSLFTRFVQENAERFVQWLKEVPQKPFIITADSKDEALAFLFCLNDAVQSENCEPIANSIVLDTPEALLKFDPSTLLRGIFVIHNTDTEVKIGDFFRRCHCIIVRSGNDLISKPDIRLGILGRKDFYCALESMELPAESIEKLARKSARSPTILRRCLSIIPALKAPPWADNFQIARKLLPTTLVGAWNIGNSTDREIIRLLGNVNIESEFSELLALENAPVWSAGSYRGVVSRTDSLFGIAKFVTIHDLNNFFIVAEIALSKRIPAIDVSYQELSLVNLRGKVREHSDALLRGIRETLIIFAVFGADLFNQRLGVNVKARVNKFIHNLLSPFNYDRLLSQNSNLPEYAEAAPKAFLSIIESDLNRDIPTVIGLKRPVEDLYSPVPDNTYLLWALECLAWNPSFFQRVVNIVAKICVIDRESGRDNWANSPENTLKSFFQSSLPMTSAPINMRYKVFEILCSRYPELGWRLCVSHLDRKHAKHNYRPRWRNYAGTAGREPLNRDEDVKFVTKTVDLALNWPKYDEFMLADLIDRFPVFSGNDQLRIWNLIDHWISLNPEEEAKAYVRQRIHRLNRIRSSKRRKVFHVERIQEVSRKLQPTNIVARYKWLFDSHLVNLPREDIKNVEYDYRKNDRKRFKLRLKALRKIWKNLGFNGIAELLNQVEHTSQLIGELLAKILSEQKDAKEFVEACLHALAEVDKCSYKYCLIGFLRNADTEFNSSLIKNFRHNSDLVINLFLCLPYRKTTWLLLDDEDESLRKSYWKFVKPGFSRISNREEVNRSIDELLAVNRAVDAFSSADMIWAKVETSRLKKLLDSLITVTPDEFQQNTMFSYCLSEAFDELDRRSSISIDEKAKLEFAFLPLLEYSEHGLPNLEAKFIESPNLFVHAIRCLYKRADGSDDFSELGFVSRNQLNKAAKKFYVLLDRVRRIPGTNSRGEIDLKTLKEWLYQVRTLCQQHDRFEIGDKLVGELLSYAKGDEDGTWPCRQVCEVLEWMASDQVGIGFSSGVRKHEGRTGFREEGAQIDEDGKQWQEIAVRYQNWARDTRYEFPYVGNLLEQIAAFYESAAEWWNNETNLINRHEN